MTTHLTLQERVRQFNLGTPTPMHVGTHELVNDLWKANADMLAALRAVEEWWLAEGMSHHTGAPYAIFATRAAITKATGAPA